MEQPKFRVAVREVRDRFGKLMEIKKKIESVERRAFGMQGVDHDEDEVYRSLTDIHNRIEDVKLIWETANDKEKRQKRKRKKQKT